MKLPSKVTIIINCFNGENFINDCISSVLAQTYSNWELVFWDNLSTDNTAKILKKFKDKRIKYFKAIKHTNLPNARNLALEKAKSDLIAFLDIDDTWHKDKLKYQVEEINKNQNFSFCYTKTKVIYEDLSPPQNKNQILSKISTQFFSQKSKDRLLISNFIYFSSVLINQNLLSDKKLFNDKYEQAEDYDLLLKLSSVGKVIYINKELTKYRIHNNNLSIKKRLLFFKEKEIIINSLPLLNIKSKEKALYQNQIEKAVYFWKKRQTFKSFEILKNQNKYSLNRIFYFLLFQVSYDLIKRILNHKSIFDK